jgi:hypothetical protein
MGDRAWGRTNRGSLHTLAAATFSPYSLFPVPHSPDEINAPAGNLPPERVAPVLVGVWLACQENK